MAYYLISIPSGTNLRARSRLPGLVRYSIRISTGYSKIWSISTGNIMVNPGCYPSTVTAWPKDPPEVEQCLDYKMEVDFTLDIPDVGVAREG
jgi:hypothetical protein